MLKKRIYEKSLKSFLKNSPAVVLVGPRQCGKTTLAKSIKGIYFDLEKPEDQLRLEVQWQDLSRSEELLILDEPQEFSVVFSWLRSAIDERRKKMGRFLLLGSIAPELMKAVSDSLAGRAYIIEMTPFLSLELSRTPWDKLWLYGGYPDGGILSPKAFGIWQESYLALLSQRDLPKWGLPAKPITTMRLFKMLAAVHAQIWNASEIGASLGLSYHTVNTYTEFLTGVYLIRTLEPFHANLRKRLVKSPRIYWRDSGLLHALLGVRGQVQNLLAQPWVGASWEGWIIEQVISSCKSSGHSPDAYFFRTQDGKEIDLVLSIGSQLFAIEIKLTSVPTQEMFQKLNAAASLIHATKKILISRTNNTLEGEDFISTNLSGAIRYINKYLSRAP